MGVNKMKKSLFIATFLVALLVLSVIPIAEVKSASPSLSFTDSRVVVSSEPKSKDVTIQKSFTITNIGDVPLTSLTLTSLSFSDFLVTGTINPSSSLDVGSSATVSLTVKIPADSDIGENTQTLTINAHYNNGTSNNASISFTEPLLVRVNPEYCIAGIQEGEISIDITSPDSGDSFDPGETIPVEIEIDNDGDKDRDFIVKAVLYDVDDNDRIDSAESDSISIDSGDSDTATLDLEVPTGTSLSNSHSYVIYLKAYASGKESTVCTEEDVDVELDIPSHKVVISDYSLSPSTVQCGDTVVASLTATNVGSNQEKTRLRAFDDLLGINVVSDTFTIDKMGKSDDEITRTLQFVVPTTAQSKQYQIQLSAETGSGSTESQLANLLVSCGVQSGSSALSLPSSIIRTEKGSSLDLPVTVINPYKAIKTFTVEANQVSGISSTGSQQITLGENEQGTVTLSFNVDDSASTGTKSVAINLKDGTNIISTKTAQITVESKSLPITGNQNSVFGNWFSSNNNLGIFLIVADILLVLIALYVIMLIFRKRRKD